LFIDELHTLVGAGAAEGAIDAASILKPMLARGELQTIGATTLDEYRKHLEKDAALERRFQPVQVAEPTIAHTIEILRGLRDRYEAHHRVSITDGALVAAAQLADRYVSDRFLPDKAIDLIDEAGSRMRIRRMTAPPGLRESGEKIAGVRREKESATGSQDFEKAAALRDNEKELTGQRDAGEKEWKAGGMDAVAEVTAELIAEVLAAATGIPVFKLTEEESRRLLRMEDELHRRVIGQDVAVKSLSQAIRRTRAGLKDPKRPGGSFIFAGPSGVGKTELSRTLAEFLFGDEDSLIQLDMSEYMERHTVSRLFGSPPGYVGYEEGGQLTEKVRRKPFSVVLFDEIEKAHPDIFNSLLQILEDGRLTDAQGRMVDFKNTVIIMTTNLGTKDISKGVSLGFARSGESRGSYDRMKNKVQEELKSHFRPEFLNRVDDIIVFHQLERDEIFSIVDLMIAKVDGRLKDRDMAIELRPAAGTCCPSAAPTRCSARGRRAARSAGEGQPVREDPVRRADRARSSSWTPRQRKRPGSPSTAWPSRTWWTTRRSRSWQRACRQQGQHGEQLGEQQAPGRRGTASAVGSNRTAHRNGSLACPGQGPGFHCHSIHQPQPKSVG
jgi:ATP-dependent Clp protease ATP-binding subunit ClpC